MPRRAPATAARRPRHAALDRLAPVVLALVALALRLWLWPRTAGLTMDSPLYVRMAEALLAGERGPSPAHHGYSLLIALASTLVHDRELPGRLVSLLASLALPALAWAIARPRVPAWAALAAGLAVAVHPLLAVYGVALMTEATFLALTFGGLLAIEREHALTGGALLGAAYWVRPEAAVIAPMAALLTRRPRTLALVLAGAAIAALPYLGVLRWEQGWWSLTPKTALVRPAFANAAAAEWRLADSTALADTVGLAERLRAGAPGMLASYGPQLAHHAARLLEAWPLPLLVLSLSGLFAAPRAWLAPLACLLVYPLLAAPDDVRFAQLFVPTLALLAAHGVSRFAWPRGRGALGGRGARTGRARDGVGRARRAPRFRVRRRPHAHAARRRRVAARALAARRRGHGPQGVRAVLRRRHVQLPDDSLATIVDYAQRGAACDGSWPRNTWPSRSDRSCSRCCTTPRTRRCASRGWPSPTRTAPAPARAWRCSRCGRRRRRPRTRPGALESVLVRRVGRPAGRGVGRSNLRTGCAVSRARRSLPPPSRGEPR